jgi:hypothetical protein
LGIPWTDLLRLIPYLLDIIREINHALSTPAIHL